METREGPEERLSEVEVALGNRFLLHSILGKGASGTVYLATDRSTNTPVAIKLLHPLAAHADQRSLDHFQEELKLAAGLLHPNIARLLSSGNTEDRRPYYVAEWLDGTDLGALLRGGLSLGIKLCKLQWPLLTVWNTSTHGKSFTAI